MKRILMLVVLLLTAYKAYSQGNTLYQTGITADQNLKAIGSLAPYSTGGMGFDTRYEGTKGSPFLFDTLYSSFLNVKDQDYYIQLAANLDLVKNSLIFRNPKTGKLLALPSDMVNEIKIDSGGKEMIFRTSKARFFEKDVKEGRFYQVLKDGQYQFIKMPLKKFIEADYKAVYSADRRYDEYVTHYKYYIMRSDSTFGQIQLNKKSLIKLFPDKKDLIDNAFSKKANGNKEDLVLDILNKL
jgi:hypothetical protein